MSKRSLRLSLLAAGVGAIALLVWAFSPRPVEVDVGSVVKAPFVEVLTDDGITRVRERFQVTAPVAGTLLRPTARVGDAVERGEPVATILPSAPDLVDPRTRAELVARREAAGARSARATTLMNDAEAARLQAEQDLRRIEALARSGFVAASQRDAARRLLDERRSLAEAARFDAEASRHDLEQARAALSRLDDLQRQPGGAAAAWQVRAPVTGRVLSLPRDSGGPVGVGAELMTIGDVSRLEAVVDVLSTEATRVRSGSPVELNAGAGTVLRGRVRCVEPAAFTRISALGIEEQRVNVVIDLLDDATHAGRVGHGFRVDARIELDRVEDAMQVPTAALVRVGERWAVFALRGGRARIASIDIGAMSEATAIVRSGLAQGDRVVLYPGDDLQDGSRVRERAPPP